MAVKKAKKENEVEVDVATAVVDPIPEIDAVEDGTETVDETPEVEVETETTVETSKDVDVTIEDTVVDNTKKPIGNVKIRMRVDHKCCIAMERYDLKAGKVYTVPANVKTILNKAGLLSPI